MPEKSTTLDELLSAFDAISKASDDDLSEALAGFEADDPKGYESLMAQFVTNEGWGG